MKLHANARTCLHCRSLIVNRVIEDNQSPASVAVDFRVSPRTVHKWVKRFREHGINGLSDRSSRPHQIPRCYLQPSRELHDAVFSVLHSPPSAKGFNRTTWRLKDLHKVLRSQGIVTTSKSISAVIKRAGYRWKQARITLTSTDTAYAEKVKAIRSTLAGLQDDEAFLSIDEFGPFAVKMRGGKSLHGPNEVKVVPQWQSSKGSLIVTAALELRRNQVIHFFSDKKDSNETIKLVELIRKSYAGYRKVYLSWDAAPWHSSKALWDKIDFLNGWAKHDHAPEIEVVPLPSRAQFLNVIESVFSGMARAIIHNSDYSTVGASKAAIDRYFAERNDHFIRSPHKAGKAIWRNEPAVSTFQEANNCKDAIYR
jgi:transposase